MNIEPKTVTDTKTVTSSFSISKLNDSHVTMDDPMRKTLRIQLVEAMPPQNVIISAAEYDSLGQWTDESLCTFLVAKYGLVAAS